MGKREKKQKTMKIPLIISIIASLIIIILILKFTITSETLEYLENSGEIPEEEIQTIKRIIDNIYEQREKKIMKAALSKARGGKPDLKNLLNAEKNLFDSTLNILIQSRTKFFSKY